MVRAFLIVTFGSSPVMRFNSFARRTSRCWPTVGAVVDLLMIYRLLRPASGRACFVRRILRVRRVDQHRHGSDTEMPQMPLADIPAETALVGSESVAVARQPVCLIVEHVMTLRAVGHASTVADDVAFSPSPPPTANKALDPTAWAVLFLSEFSMIRHLVSSVEFSLAHAAGARGRTPARSRDAGGP